MEAERSGGVVLRKEIELRKTGTVSGRKPKALGGGGGKL